MSTSRRISGLKSIKISFVSLCHSLPFLSCRMLFRLMVRDRRKRLQDTITHSPTQLPHHSVDMFFHRKGKGNMRIRSKIAQFVEAVAARVFTCVCVWLLEYPRNKRSSLSASALVSATCTDLNIEFSDEPFRSVVIFLFFFPVEHILPDGNCHSYRSRQVRPLSSTPTSPAGPLFLVYFGPPNMNICHHFNLDVVEIFRSSTLLANSLVFGRCPQYCYGDDSLFFYKHTPPSILNAFHQTRAWASWSLLIFTFLMLHRRLIF